MKSFPPEIVKTVSPQTKQERNGFVIMALPVMCIALGYLAFSVATSYTLPTLIILFLHAFFALMIWNLFNLVIFDWLIFCKINPAFMVLPGTKGNPAYQDYRYHFIGFLKGIILCIVAAVVISVPIYIISQFYIS